MVPDLNEQEAVKKLGDAIFHASRVSTDDPVAEWDAHNKNYVTSIQPALTSPSQSDNYKTLNFDDGIKGWVSFFTYKPDQPKSLKNIFPLKNKDSLIE